GALSVAGGLRLKRMAPTIDNGGQSPPLTSKSIRLSHCLITQPEPNRSTTSTAFFPIRWRSVELFINRSIAATNAAESFGGTRMPSTPSLIISLGPLGQSHAITGNPQAIASIKALGNPSYSEVMTKRSADLRSGEGSRALPAN